MYVVLAILMACIMIESCLQTPAHGGYHKHVRCEAPPAMLRLAASWPCTYMYKIYGVRRPAGCITWPESMSTPCTACMEVYTAKLPRALYSRPWPHACGVWWKRGRGE